MSKYVTDGTASIYHVDFIVNGQLVVPTEASYQLCSNDGTTIGGSPTNRPITLPSLATGVDLEISESDNTATVENEIRYVDVSFTYNNIEYSVSDYYLIKDSIRLPISKQDVRSILGVTDVELTDPDIDLIEALYLAQQDIPETDIEAIFTSGSALVPAAIIAVKTKAAILASVCIENYMLQSEQADTSVYKRFMEIDFEAMRKALQERYNAAINVVAGVTDPTVPLLSTMAVGVDNVTGQ